MPEGPSILLIKEQIAPLFTGKKVTMVMGNAGIAKEKLLKQKITAIRSWGKHLLICFPQFTVRIHFLLFGSYSLQEQTRQDRSIRLMIQCGKRKVYFYTCSVKILEGEVDELYDWRADVLGNNWSAARAKKKIQAFPAAMACDIVLNQEIFAGAGNIIKNETLYRVKIHPESKIKNIPARKIGELIRETRNYSFDFLRWKKEFTLKKHWLAHTKKVCKRCDLPITRKICGKTKRRSFFCKKCQIKY
jgi:endonuclease VIII